MSEVTLKINLSEAALEELKNLAARANETADSLVRGFIADLTQWEKYSGDSDGWSIANNWYSERYRYELIDNTEWSFAQFLIDYYDGIDGIDEFLKEYENSKEIEAEIDYLKEELKDEEWDKYETTDGKPYYKNKEEWKQDVSLDLEAHHENKKWAEEHLKEFFDEYKNRCGIDTELNLEEETEKLRKWKKDMERNVERETDKKASVESPYIPKI